MSIDEFFSKHESDLGPWITVWRNGGQDWRAEIYTEMDEPPVYEASGGSPGEALAALLVELEASE